MNILVGSEKGQRQRERDGRKEQKGEIGARESREGETRARGTQKSVNRHEPVGNARRRHGQVLMENVAVVISLPKKISCFSLLEALQTGSAFSREQKRKRGPRPAGGKQHFYFKQTTTAITYFTTELSSKQIRNSLRLNNYFSCNKTA